MSGNRTKSFEALERFLSDMDLSSPKFDDDYELRLEEMRTLLNPPIRVGFKRLSEDAVIPTKAHPTDSGFDLVASEDVIVEPGETKIVPTGIAVELPPGYEATVRPRSGITAKTKLRVQLGTIDQDYRGEIGVIVDNITVKYIELWQAGYYRTGGEMYLNHRVKYPVGTYKIRKGDRIAQLVIQPLPAVEAYEVEGDLKETDRGEGGFGSSGVRE